MGSSSSSESSKKSLKNSTKPRKGSSSVPEKRSFNKQYYYTDFREYHSKEETKIVISFLKKKIKTIKVRSVSKNSSIYLYFDEEGFNQIKNGNINLPTIEQIPQNKDKELKKTKDISQIELNSQVQVQKQLQKHPKKGNQKRPQKEMNKQSQKQSLNQNIKKQMEDFLINSSKFPPYLLTRLSKEAQSLMKIRLLDIEKLPRKKLERCIDVLRAEQVKYDITFDKEKDIIDYMNNLSKLMNLHVQKYMERESEEFIQNFIIESLKEGKFDKHLAKIEKKGIDEVSYLIFKALKGKAKKYPFTETHLIKKIHSVLEKRERKENKKN